MDKNFGARLKRLRTAAGLTKSELSRRSGVSREYIYQLENVRPNTQPGIKVAQPLADTLGVYVGYLVSGEEMVSMPSGRSEVYAIPIYSECYLHAGDNNDLAKSGFLYRARTKGRDAEHLEAYVVSGTNYAPIINDGDCIVVDRKASIDDGDIVICNVDEKPIFARLKKVGGELWLESNEGHYRLDSCGYCAVVKEVIRTLK